MVIKDEGLVVSPCDVRRKSLCAQEDDLVVSQNEVSVVSCEEVLEVNKGGSPRPVGLVVINY